MLFTTDERLLYLELFIYCWKDGVLPFDLDALMAIAGMKEKPFREAWKRVQTQFVLRDDGYHHHKVDEKMRDIESWHELRREAGKRGGLAKAKALANGVANGVANAIAKPKPSTSTSTTTSRETPPSPSEPDLNIHERITAATATWPNPAALVTGRRLLCDAVCQSTDPARTLATIEANTATWAEHYRAAEPRYRKNLANYARDDDWQNPAPPPQAPKGIHRVTDLALEPMKPNEYTIDERVWHTTMRFKPDGETDWIATEAADEALRSCPHCHGQEATGKSCDCRYGQLYRELSAVGA